MGQREKVDTFSNRVVCAALSVPEGRVTTYGRIARAAGGGALSSQSITRILSKAKESAEIPYHRIVYADGRIWVTDRLRSKRMKLYKKEGIEVDDKDRIRNFSDILFEFK